MEGEEGSNGGGDSTSPEDNSSVRVALRIRPRLPREVIEGCKTCTTVAEGHPQVWIGSNHAFTYDYVYDEQTQQSIIFDNVVKQLLDGCLNGYNATVLAYGQTGSGKTFTMGTGFEYASTSDGQGIIPRAVEYLFSQIEIAKVEKVQEKPDFKVQVNFVELYNEEVVDLLNQSGPRPSSASRPSSANSGGIRIHEDASGSIYLAGIQTIPVSSSHETLNILREGALSRTTASTNMNDTSSRSHAIFTIHVTQTRVSNQYGDAELETLSAKFHFVDLAGSERLKRTLATGDRQKEGISINCGLLALGNVISALGDRSRRTGHVPYRDSKLTRLLQDSLGGNSRTVMIACVSPSDRDFVETLNTLKYANRARNIKNKVQINQDTSSRTIASLRKQIEQLESELLEYKQGKRGAIDSLEYQDNYQENMLLLAEVESLKSRLKSKQESIDKLTAVIAAHRAEEDIKNLTANGNSDCDLTNMIQNYIVEIEDLRTKLFEAEQECQKLRSRQRQMNTSLSSPRRQLFVETPPRSDVLEDARAEIENDRKKLEQLSGKAKEDDESGEQSDSDTEEEQQEKLQEIANLSNEISVKERLIEELERSQKHLENMKRHYEEKLECLFAKVKATEQERDKVLGNLSNGKRSAQVTADYDKKLANMQAEIKKWQNLQKEHSAAVKQHANTSRQLDRLRVEVDSLKQIKVKLIKQAKIDSARFREQELKRQKEILTLKKAQRVKDIKLKTLENEKIMRDQVLKRKLEEVSNLKRQNKIQMSRKAQGRSRSVASPVKAKSKWNNVQHEIRKSVTIKTTAAALEKEMMNLIQERTISKNRLQDLENIPCKDDITAEEIESLNVNLNFLEERISEIQNQIAEISSNIKDYDGTEFDTDEIHYVFKKVYEMNVMNLTDLERSERRVDDLEETVKQQAKEIGILRDMLHHLYTRQRTTDEDDDEVPALPPPPPVLDYQSHSAINGNDTTSAVSKVRKARRLTSTPQELLGSAENVAVASKSTSEFLNPNDINLGSFSRATRQTQSMRLSSSKQLPRKHPLNRQDTYTVADRRFQALEQPERLKPERPEVGNRNGNNDVFNTTFLIEKSPPPVPLASSSIKLTNSPSDSICDNNTNTINVESKGYIKKISTGVKDRVLTLTHCAEGHLRPVISMFATEQKLFTGSKDATAKEFDLTSGVELSTYTGHPHNVQCVKFLESESTLITASSHIVKLWDTRSGAVQKILTSSGLAHDKLTFETHGLIPHGEHVIQSVAVLRDYLYTTSEGRIRVWDKRKLTTPLGLLAGKHFSTIMCLATAENVELNGEVRDVIVSGSKDHYIKMYAFSPELPVGSIQPRKNLNPPHYDGIEALLIKGTELYSGSRDTCIKRWDMVESKMICCANNAHTGWITGLSNLPDSSMEHIVSSSRDGSIKIWDKEMKEVLKVDVGSITQNQSNQSFSTNSANSSNYSIESLCVNHRLVFTAGATTVASNNNANSANGLVSMWTFDEEILIAYKNLFGYQNKCYSRYALSPRLNVRKTSNKIRYRSHEDLMSRSTGFELPY